MGDVSLLLFSHLSTTTTTLYISLSTAYESIRRARRVRLVQGMVQGVQPRLGACVRLMGDLALAGVIEPNERGHVHTQEEAQSR